MIAQGTDGVSRGYLALGIMAGEAMCSFIPIHQTACKRSPKLVKWIKVWSGSNSIILDPMGWFEKGHDIPYQDTLRVVTGYRHCRFVVMSHTQTAIDSKVDSLVLLFIVVDFSLRKISFQL